MNNGNRFYAGMSTPWGRIQDHHRIADGVVSVSTAGTWRNLVIGCTDQTTARALSAVHRHTALERGGRGRRVVLQYLGLLSLIPEPLELQVTAEDIDKGRKSRKPSEYKLQW